MNSSPSVVAFHLLYRLCTRKSRSSEGSHMGQVGMVDSGSARAHGKAVWG